jgi:hypothetical protein
VKHLQRMTEILRREAEAIHRSIGELRRAAEAKGATLESESSGGWCVWQIEAPTGYTWGGDVHALRVEWRSGVAAHRDAAIADAIQRMAETELVACNVDCECMESDDGQTS